MNIGVRMLPIVLMVIRRSGGAKDSAENTTANLGDC